MFCCCNYVTGTYKYSVDYRTTCYCHGNPVSVAFACSVCLAVHCHITPICDSCGYYRIYRIYRITVLPFQWSWYNYRICSVQIRVQDRFYPITEEKEETDSLKHTESEYVLLM